MAEHPNAVKYREVTEAFNTGNMEVMNNYVAMTSSGGTSVATNRCAAKRP